MLRSRSLKEGSLGLLIIAGIAIFGGISLWLRGFQFGQSKYQIIATFSDIKGTAVGDPIRFRGLKIGNIKDIKPIAGGVEIVMEISSSKILIPKNYTIKVTSSGLIGETFIDIQPPDTKSPSEVTTLPPEASEIGPLSNKCSELNLILCDDDRVSGETAITLDDLLPMMYELNQRLAKNPEIFDHVGAAAENASVAAAEITKLSQDVSSLVGDVQQELGTFSDTAKAITDVAQTASETIETTSEQLTQLTNNANEVLTENRTQLATTLNNITNISENLHSLVAQLDNTIAQTDTKQLIQNLETLTANAAETSTNLKEISNSFSDPNTLVNLQQTLDSARVTFANAQKITADLEEITGDPNFRNDIRNLVDGLSNLLSSTQKLEQQVQISINAQALEKSLSITNPKNLNLPNRNNTNIAE